MPIVSSGTIQDVKRLGSNLRRHEEIEQAFFDAAISRILAAQQDGDDQLAGALMDLIGRLETANSRQALVRVVRDVDLRLDGRGDNFLRWLGESKVSGAAAATRVRVELLLAADRTEGMEQWMTIIARHGDASDAAWLSARDGSPIVRTTAVTALVKGGSEESSAEVLALAVRGRVSGSQLAAFAEVRPADAHRLAIDLLRPEHAEVLRRNQVIMTDVMAALARATDQTTLSQTVEVLNALRTDDQILAATACIQILVDRNFAVTGLEPAMRAPLLLLERHIADRSRDGIVAVAASLDRSRCLWNDEYRGALVRARDVLDTPSDKEWLDRLLKRMARK